MGQAGRGLSADPEPAVGRMIITNGGYHGAARPDDAGGAKYRTLSPFTLKSTGSKTEQGKRRSRRNPARRAFEDAIVAKYLPQTPVEQELVHRLASLFWRLRRATSIKTGLLRM